MWHWPLDQNTIQAEEMESAKNNGPARVLTEVMTVALMLIFSALPKIKYSSSINVNSTSE